MKKRKTLQDLTIKDNFMFGAVMSVEENCKGFLEMVLGFPIARVVVSKEKSMIYHPEYKGVRLDIYAEDAKHTHYNVEMQVERKAALGKRSRYYQSQMDMELLLSGEDYSELPDTYVIFICDFDPFEEEKYRYTFKMNCKESGQTNLEDGRTIVFLNTHGKNESEVPKELVTFLRYVKADLAESEEAFDDPYVEQLQKFIRKVKRSREMEERFMIFEEMLKEEHAQGLEEGRREGLVEGCVSTLKETLLLFLKKFGEVPNEISEQIQLQQETEVLKHWMKIAFQSETLDEFIQKM